MYAPSGLARPRALHAVVTIVLVWRLLAPSSAGAVELVAFDFDDDAGGFELAPERRLPALLIESWFDQDGTLTDFGGNPGLALAAVSFHDGNTLAFDIRLAPHALLSIHAFRFDQRASASGPTDWRLSVGSDLLAGGLTTTAFTTLAGSVMSGPHSGSVTVSLTGSGAAAARGTWRIDNFQLQGEVLTALPVTTVSEPASLLLLLLSVAGLVGLRFSGSV